jgi:hypothetical protein
MNKRIMQFAVVFCVLLGISALLAPGLTAKAQGPVEIGVHPGDRFTYGTSDGSPWVTMHPSYMPPLPQWNKFQNLTTWNITVIPNKEVYDYPYQIWVNQTVGFRNGTALQPMQGLVDVNIGLGTIVLFFIPSGLQAGERIYPGSTNFTWSVNQTRIDETHWPGRTLCVLNHTIESLNSTTHNVFGLVTTIYWDQVTGVLLSAFEEAISYNTVGQAGIEGFLLYQLIANNVGIPLDYSQGTDLTPIYALTAIALVVAVVFVIVRATRTPPKKYKGLKGR